VPPAVSAAAASASASALVTLMAVGLDGIRVVPLQRLTDDLRRLRMSLSPLRRIEEVPCMFHLARPRAANAGQRRLVGAADGARV